MPTNDGVDAPSSSVTSSLTYPDQITGLTASLVSSSRLDLAWTAATGTTYYDIYRGTDSYNFAVVASTTGLTYSDTGLTPATKYYYQVKGHNDTGFGYFSSSANCTTDFNSPVGGGGGGGGGTVNVVKPVIIKTIKPVIKSNNPLIALILSLLSKSQSASPVAPISALPTTVLQVGSIGEEVTQLQIKLKNLGYFKHPFFTKYFGLVTQEAVRNFQKEKGIIPATGNFGPKTRAMMESLGL